MMMGKKRVLVIDDDELDYLRVRRELLSERFDVTWSKNRTEALAEIARRSPDVIILDLRLSDRSDDRSGLELLKELRASWARIQVIVFTSVYLAPDMVVECMKSGAYYYFDKKQFETAPMRFLDLVTEALAYKPKEDVIENTYPHPLALLYRDYRRNVVVPQLKFRRLIEVGEFLVKLSAIICLAALDGDRRTAGGRMVTNSLFKPTLGAWFEYLRYAIGQPARSGLWVDKMRDIFTGPRRNIVDSLVKIRNEWLGHGVTRSEHEYTQMIERWEEPLVDLLNASTVLSVWQFFVVKSTRFIADNRYVHTIVNIKGDNPKFLSEEIELPVNCQAYKAYVWAAPEQLLLSIYPWLSVFNCDQCNQETVFLYDKLEKERVLYLDYANGHHSLKVEPYRDVKRLLESTNAP